MEEPIERARFTNPARQKPDQWTTDALTPLTRLTDAEQEVVRIVESGETQVVEPFTTVTHQYWGPFNYPNIRVEIGESSDAPGEFNPDGVELAIPLQWKYPRSGVKMKIDNLWGQHLRF